MSSTLVTETSVLPLESASLRVDARAGVARAVLEQTFKNLSPAPMRVTYTLPLPADAAVSGFRFRVGERTIEGTIDKKQRARERFEEALANGQTAAILEQERTSLFTQEIGNVPPGATVVCEVEIDQKLRFLDEGSWEWRFPLAAAPRYLGQPGRVADAAKVAFDVAEQIGARASLSMSVRDVVVTGRSPESPSHPLSCVDSGGAFRVELGSGNAVPLDRDVVVRWPVATDRPSITIDTCGPRDGRLADAHALCTIVPPRKDAHRAPVPRDLTILLDTSGSMGGQPLEQAKRVALAMVDSLGDHDRVEMIEFSNEPTRWRTDIAQATRDTKRAAASWIRGLRASGGTEMRTGILEALRPRHARDGALTQVVLVTDGLIGFEQEIVKEILSLLPRDARLHTVGVGSSVNRSLTQPAARAGRGIEVVIGLGEDPERAVARLLARSVAPAIAEIEVSGSALLEIAPAKVPDVFAGAPLLLSARCKREGGEIVLRGKTAEGAWEERIRVPASHATEGSDAVATLYGREAVEDAEMRIAAGAAPSAMDMLVESLGLSYRIATRMTSWVAIDTQRSVDPRDPTRHVQQPQALPHGLSVEGLGLRAQAPMQGVAAAGPMMPRSMPMPMRPAAPPAGAGYGRSRSTTLGAPPPPPAEAAKAGDLFEDADEELAGGAPEPEENTRASAIAAPRKEEERKKGFFERVRGAFTGRSTTTIVWIGRIVFAKDGQLVIEIVAEGRTLDWKLATEAIAIDKNGVRTDLAVDESRTTREGTYENGAVVRLALQVPADFDASTLGTVLFAGVHVEIRA
ncbi:MAG TPA: VIT domain-containing protein [Polyangiaceae bacterium]